MVLHTFGRDLKWNPHIHCLISEGGYSDNGFWRNVNYFNYTYLRNAFRTALLNEMEAETGLSFKKVKALCYKEQQEGFYVYAKPNTEKLHIKYMDNPPEGMTSEDIRRMSEDDLLDMDYFLNEDDPFNDDFGGEGFYIF